MVETRKGRQTPTQYVTLPYVETHGQEAIDYYNSTGRIAQEWQELLTYDILAVNEEGLWVHTKFGFSIPRRNGKNEIVAIREIYGLLNGEHILHTAHRTTTSSSASKRLASLLSGMGYTEVSRIKKGEKYDKLAEGYYTVKALCNLGKAYGVELPICEAVYQILYENRNPDSILHMLFSRSLKNEF